MHKHHTRARMLHAFGYGRGPALRDAPPDGTPAPSGGGNAGGTGSPAAGDGEPAAGSTKPTIVGDVDKDRVAAALGAARDSETKAKARATAAETQLAAVLKALGKNPDGTALTDPEAHAKTLAQRATAAEEALWGATVKLELSTLAPGLGANVKALLDSVSFVDSLDELADDDPSKPEFTKALENKIKAALAANPALRASTGPVRQGADITGSGGGGTARPTSLSAAISKRMGA